MEKVLVKASMPAMTATWYMYFASCWMWAKAARIKKAQAPKKG